jgi:pilus assembly protein CpaE
MPALSVVVITGDEEQRSLLQVLIDSTAVAHMTQAFGAYPQTDGDPMLRRIHDLKADVVLVDLYPEVTAAALRAIELLRAACSESSIFAVGEMAKPQLIVDAMRVGAQEFLPRPSTIDQLLDAFNRFVTSQRKVRATGTRGRVFAVLNVKGGNGATTVAVNTSLAIAMSQGSTALVDMAPLGNAAVHLNLKPGFTIMDALNNLHRLDVTLLDGFMARHETGMHLLGGHPGVTMKDAGPQELAKMFDIIVTQYRNAVVDLSTRLDTTTRAVCDLADAVLLVANPDLSSLWSAARIREFFTGSPAENKLKLVLNRYRKIGGFGDSDIEQATQTKILCKIPNNYAVINSAIERGVPVVRQNNSDLARCFADLARTVTVGAQPNQGKRWPFGASERLAVRTQS